MFYSAMEKLIWIFFYYLDKAVPLENDFYFWAFFCSVTLLLFVLISITSCFSSIFCCSILGSYLLIVAIDYYIGSSFKYIIINVIRRITISGFDVAVVNPPYGSQGNVLLWKLFLKILQEYLGCDLSTENSLGRFFRGVSRQKRPNEAKPLGRFFYRLSRQKEPNATNP